MEIIILIVVIVLVFVGWIGSLKRNARDAGDAWTALSQGRDLDEVRASSAIKRMAKDLEPKKSGCYIATAVYGSYDSPNVVVLRRYRDTVLDKTLPGRTFIKAYYRISPPLAEKLRNTTRVNLFVKALLDKFVIYAERRMAKRGIDVYGINQYGQSPKEY